MITKYDIDDVIYYIDIFDNDKLQIEYLIINKIKILKDIITYYGRRNTGECKYMTTEEKVLCSQIQLLQNSQFNPNSKCDTMERSKYIKKLVNTYISDNILIDFYIKNEEANK